MLKLLLDSSSTNLSVGIAFDNRIIHQVSTYAWQRQSELMVPEIVASIKQAGFSFSDVSAVHVAVGPGSYTGVRIALTIAKTIGFALKVPVIGVSSLEILRVDNHPTICMINARSGRSYFGVYQGHKAMIADTIRTNDEVVNYIKEHPDYLISGQLEYLNMVGEPINIFINLLGTNNAPIANIHALKPVYLKENL
jgi:tRNA threonylcarbamoyl adenosine modification protein YeaZ